jgi:hypothetical protein
MPPNRKFTGSLQRRYKKHWPKVTTRFSCLTVKAPHRCFLSESRIPLPRCLCVPFWAQFPLSFNLNKSVSNQRKVHLLTHLQILFLGKKKPRERVCARMPFNTKGGYWSRVCKKMYTFPSREKRMNKHRDEVRPLCCLREDWERRDTSSDGVGAGLCPLMKSSVASTMLVDAA